MTTFVLANSCAPNPVLHLLRHSAGIAPSRSIARGLASGNLSGSHMREGCSNPIYLPSVIHRDDIRRGRVDFHAARQREDADRTRLIQAGRKPPQAGVRCDHTRAIKKYTFADGKVLELYGCGCSNGKEILNRRSTR